MITMNKKLLCLLCLLLSVVMLYSTSCGKKKENSRDKNTTKVETIWDNISDYEINSNMELEIAAQGGHNKLVGGCFDGERYAYYVLESEDGTSLICKYDTKDNTLKKTSSELNIGSINGICCKRNSLVVLYGGKNICVLDNSSFETLENHFLIFDGYGISYNKKYDSYVLLLVSGGISVLNSQFEHTFGISEIESVSARSTITCNNKYIFTLTAVENEAEIVVYDWDGNYLSTVSVSDVRLVPVCMYVDDDVLYIGYDCENGGAVYKSVITKS